MSERDNPLGQLGQMMEKMQGLQQRVAELQERLGRIEVEGDAGAGMVVAVANGRNELVSVRIEESLLRSEDREMLQDLVVVAVNAAMEKARNVAGSEMAALTGGLGGLGALGELFGGGGAPR